MLGFQLKIAKVDGHSMAPALLDEDFVLALRFPWSCFCKGQLVLVNHPRYQLMIKRIAEVKGGDVLLVGDGPCSLSSEQMGWLDERKIIGRLYCRIKAQG
ncbi:MAG: S24/S26 family peptidase [Cycloclasticus sp.]|jgi:Peptidase S24-like.